VYPCSLYLHLFLSLNILMVLHVSSLFLQGHFSVNVAHYMMWHFPEVSSKHFQFAHVTSPVFLFDYVSFTIIESSHCILCGSLHNLVTMVFRHIDLILLLNDSFEFCLYPLRQHQSNSAA
jgi:hypothetical protein